MGMARLSDLIRILAASSRSPETSLTVIARVLREGGLITTGGRGLSAAQMMPSDGASLLLAIAAQGDHTKAAETVREVGALRLSQVGMGRRNGFPSGFLADADGERFGLHGGQKLDDALATILDRYSTEGRLPPEPLHSDASPMQGALIMAERLTDPTPCSLSVTVTRDDNNYSAELKVGQRGGDFMQLSFVQNPTPKGKAQRTGDPEDGVEASLTVRPKVVHAIVCCIRNQSADVHPWRGKVE